MEESKAEVQTLEVKIQKAKAKNGELQEQLTSKMEADNLIQERLDRGTQMKEKLTSDVDKARQKLVELDKSLARLHIDALAMAYRMTIVTSFHPTQRSDCYRNNGATAIPPCYCVC